MSTISLKQIIQNQAYKIVFLQLIGIIALSSLAFILCGITSGFSIFLGGMGYGLPNLIFVWRVFRFARAQEMTTFLIAFFIGEIVKLILCGVLFLLIVKYLPISLLSVVIGLAGAIVSFWVACLWLFSKQNLAKGVTE